LNILHATIMTSLVVATSCKSRTYNESSDGALPLAWSVSAAAWTAADEQGFSDYVAKIGAARKAKMCSSVQECVAKVPPANLAPEATPSLGVIDCGRLPFLLRAYYAYRMKLPFAYNTINNPTLEGRYTSTGNAVTGFRDQSAIKTVEAFFKSAVGAYFTAYYRIPTENSTTALNAFADTYPVSITAAGVRPGTVYYDVGGHVAIVIAVRPDGTVETWNGHPDGTNTIRPFSEANFPNPPSGKRKLGGFLRFRSWKAVGGGADKKAIPNPQQDAYSLEQYEGAWAANNKTFYEYVKQKLGSGGKTNPVAKFGDLVEELCTKISDRRKSVQDAADKGLFKLPHPGLPRNIFQAAGDWEHYSTPSSDMRSKMSFMDLYAHVKNSLAAVAAGNNSVYEFSGTARDLAAAYQAKWNASKTSAECTAQAKNSLGAPMPINIENAMINAFDWSFDPYHCPELRWGLQGTKTCITDAAKLEIYAKEAKLRWNTRKDSEVPTGFDFGNNSAKPVTNFLPLLTQALSQ
jgi:hypothetical protein